MDSRQRWNVRLVHVLLASFCKNCMLTGSKTSPSFKGSVLLSNLPIDGNKGFNILQCSHVDSRVELKQNEECHPFSLAPLMQSTSILWTIAKVDTPLGTLPPTRKFFVSKSIRCQSLIWPCKQLGGTRRKKTRDRRTEKATHKMSCAMVVAASFLSGDFHKDIATNDVGC